MKNITLVIGASENPARYSYKAIVMLKAHQQKVIAFAKKEGNINDIIFVTTLPTTTDIDTITLYINADAQKMYYNYFIELQPRRVIFNPGTENPELISLLKENHIQALEACTLVMLSTKQY